MSRCTSLCLKVARTRDANCASRKSVGKRDCPPGQHGMRSPRKSDFGVKLMEKQ